MRNLLIRTCVALALSAGLANAASTRDTAFDSHSQVVHDSHGNCIRTKWQGSNDGCPPATPVAAAPAPTIMKASDITQEQRTVYFPFNSAKLDSAAIAKLDQLSTVINKSSEVSDVSIHGFTDQIGSTSYNDALAHKRAIAVKTYLDSKSRLKSTEGDVRGLGKSAPQAECAAKTRAAKINCMATERRVEVELKVTE